MGLKRLLIANRGEIAIRIASAAADLGIETVAVFSEDDHACLHTRRADEAQPLEGLGAAAYLDIEQLVEAAVAAGCDALHPGYGFCSENPLLASRCDDAGIVFVGPGAEVLRLFGSKVEARALAERCRVPLLRGTRALEDVGAARALLASLGEGAALALKADGGGGGRGIRVVSDPAKLEQAFERCRSEALKAFGRDEVYGEEFLTRARHIEIQIVGDHTGAVSHLHERECSLQRQFQKIVEVAPSPGLDPELRARLCDAALGMARQARYENIGTFEFLVDARESNEERFAFLEANPRLQVEHTVTEEVTGVDLVATQLRLAGGETLQDVGLAVPPSVSGHAMQLRINMETMQADGSARPGGGTLRAFEPPAGRGLRTDSFGYVGYTTSPRFDSLLAKLVVHSPSPDFADLVKRARRALREFRIEGISTNLSFLQSLLALDDVAANRIHTRLVEERIDELLAAATPAPLYFEAATAESRSGGLAGAQIDSRDPLAVLAHGKDDRGPAAPAAESAPIAGDGGPGPEGTIAVQAPMQGTISSVDVAEGDSVAQGDLLLVLEAMKMEHTIEAPVSGTIRRLDAAAGDTVFEGFPLVFLEEGEVARTGQREVEEIDLDHVRPDLAEVNERHGAGLDINRPEAVARRRKTHQRTARENVDDLCDEGSFAEYGGMVIAAQRRRRPVEELIEKTPADGMIGGVGRVNGELFGDAAQCVVVSYDYTVLAGTQGSQNHRKKDRLFELAERQRLPVVFLTEGGGGRPGDTDGLGVAGLDCLAFQYFGKLSGLVPLVGINSGRCFAGNAALLGCCDVVIASRNSNIGMGGPAMIEGGGLGVFRPDEVGPMDVQVPNGVVDIAVDDEAEGVEVAKQYLSYFQGPLDRWEAADQRELRNLIPENRLRIYDVRAVIEKLADRGSVLELRRAFGLGMVTAFVRIEGRPVGVVANNPTHLAGAIDSDGADKAVRFMQLCDAFDIPLLFLCDTPGIMVGPEAEKTGLVRHASRMFVTGASLTVPFFTIVLRKGYGLGAQAMAGGSFKAPLFTVAWPTGEFGGMGLEGAVKLGFRNELAAIEDPAERTAMFETMVARMYEHGKAVNMASHFEIDDVIDPMESRDWILGALRSAPPVPPRTGKKRPCVDTW